MDGFMRLPEEGSKETADRSVELGGAGGGAEVF